MNDYLKIWNSGFNLLPPYAENEDSVYLIHTKNILGAIVLGNIQDVPQSDKLEWASSWQSLMLIDKMTAIQILAYLPAALIKTVAHDKEHVVKGLADFYKCIASTLLVWEMGECLSDSRPQWWEDYESFARLSELRYAMIRGLYEKDVVDKTIFPYPPFAWLMAEASVCRQMLENRSTKKTTYQNNLKRQKQLDPDAVLEMRSAEDEKDFVSNIDAIFEGQAIRQSQKGKKGRQFDELYLHPYCLALKSWNSQCMYNENLQHFILNDSMPNPRGRKLGRRKT
ncbi:hypothetical protein [Fischerella thermalis]|uniref:hypothetical protein n=1 Tax=Fischerella thermalis TaxID=372787 RepID=UPI0011AF0813|nr:hypothetical protein [Fischerella thermalis]